MLPALWCTAPEATGRAHVRRSVVQARAGYGLRHNGTWEIRSAQGEPHV